MTENTLVKLDEVCRELQIPLICIRSYGLVGYLRVRALFPSFAPVASVQLHEGPMFQCTCFTSNACCTLQASLPEHTVIESKPDNSLEDLRCDCHRCDDMALGMGCICA